MLFYNFPNLNGYNKFQELRDKSKKWKSITTIFHLMCEYVAKNDFRHGLLKITNNETVISYFSKAYKLDENLIKSAVDLLLEVGILEKDKNEILKIVDWQKFQEIEKIEHKKELQNKRQKKHRAKEKEKNAASGEISLDESVLKETA